MPYSRTTPAFGLRGAVFVALLLLLYPVCAPRAGEVYKSVDAQGHVVYSDHADPSTAQKSVVTIDRPDPNEVARIAKEQEILKAEEIQRKRQQSTDEKKKAQQEHDAQVQCENARNRYYAMKDARRIYQRDANGNRIYYTDPEADAKREESRQAMQAACGT